MESSEAEYPYSDYSGVSSRSTAARPLDLNGKPIKPQKPRRLRKPLTDILPTSDLELSREETVREVGAAQQTAKASSLYGTGPGRITESTEPHPRVDSATASPDENVTILASVLNEPDTTAGAESTDQAFGKQATPGTTRTSTSSSLSDTNKATSSKAGGRTIKKALKREHLVRGAFGTKDELCSQCQALNLTVDKFVIDHRQNESRAQTGRPDFWGKKKMGTFAEINMKTRCPLCRLLVASMGKIPDPSEHDELTKIEGATCELYWTVDGRERILDGQHKEIRIVKRTRRLAVTWSNKNTATAEDKAYIVLVAPEGQFGAGGKINKNDGWEGQFGTGGQISNNDDSERPMMFLGRLLTAIDQSSIGLIRKWLHICMEHHSEECKVHADLKERADKDLRSSTTFTVIDVRDMCLTSLPQEEDSDVRYVALSYTWGEESRISSGHGPSKAAVETRFKTEKDNLQDLEKKGGIKNVLEGLPMAIQNAIYLTSKLGYRYLWVDSLCIVQNDRDSWDLNAEVMDVVYGNAEFTICAADGDGADGIGLKALFHPEDSQYARHAEQLTAKYPLPTSHKQPLRLMLSRPSESYIAQTRWNKRAWTFQERLLSRRCLIFVAGRMYLQCRSTTMSEDIYSEYAVAGWSVELLGAPAHTLKRLHEDPVSVYKNCLEMYTSRQLTHDEDILAAFNGLANIIHLALSEGCPPLFGLPASHFDWALLWEPEELPEPRKAKDKSFPSWSWCGWKGKKISYNRARISGPEINLSEWLQKRTWITYYIRDARGTLRLVWDPIRHVPNDRIDDRWKGYRSQLSGLPGGSIYSKNEFEFPEFDYHGRPFNRSVPKKGRVEHRGWQFLRTTPQFRRHVNVLTPGHESPKADKPLLQFWTYAADFYLGEEAVEEPFNNGTKIGEGLKRFAILDIDGDFVGTCVLASSWSQAANERKPQRFIAISDARSFDPSEYGCWSLYTESPRNPWQLYNVMMLSCESGNPDEDVAFRAGLGKVYKSAFPNGVNYGWKEIILG